MDGDSARGPSSWASTASSGATAEGTPELLRSPRIRRARWSTEGPPSATAPSRAPRSARPSSSATSRRPGACSAAPGRACGQGRPRRPHRAGTLGFPTANLDLSPRAAPAPGGLGLPGPSGSSRTAPTTRQGSRAPAVANIGFRPTVEDGGAGGAAGGGPPARLRAGTSTGFPDGVPEVRPPCGASSASGAWTSSRRQIAGVEAADACSGAGSSCRRLTWRPRPAAIIPALSDAPGRAGDRADSDSVLRRAGSSVGRALD